MPLISAVGGVRFCAAPTALRSSSGLIPSPPGLGSRFGDRPSGPRIHRDFCSVILSQLATRKPTAPRDGKKARRVLWYPPQAKTGLEWGTQPSLPVKELQVGMTKGWDSASMGIG